MVSMTSIVSRIASGIASLALPTHPHRNSHRAWLSVYALSPILLDMNLVPRIAPRRRILVTIAVFGCILFLGAAYGQEPLALAQALLRQNKAKDALPILLELRRTAPSDPNVCQQIGITYTQLEDLGQAEIFYREAVHLNPQFWAARKNLATVLWFLDRKDEAEREFQAVTKALPADPVPHLYLGLAAHARREFQRAKLQFEKAGALASDNPEACPAVLESYLATRDMSFPGKITDQLASAESTDPEVLSRVGQLFFQYGYPDRAAAAFEKLVVARSNSPE